MTRKIIGGLIASLAVALLTGAPAQADPTSDAFVKVVKDYGIHSKDGDSGLIQVGRNICGWLRAGDSTRTVYDRIYYQSSLTRNESAYLLGASQAAFCPETM